MTVFCVRSPHWAVLALRLLNLAGICVLIGNAWLFLALPFIALAQGYAPYVPRLRWFFWTFYAAHLVALTWLAGVWGATPIR